MTQAEVITMAQQANNEVYLWIVSSVLSFVISIGIIIATGLVKSLTKKLNDLVEAMSELNVSNATIIEQLKTIFKNSEETNRRLNDHAERLRALEINHSKCRSCQEASKMN